MKICLDAGHSKGQNRSPADGRYFEGEQMFRLQKFLKEELESYGVQVLCTRTQLEDNPSLLERAQAARGCDLLLSLHSNAVGNGCCETVDYVRVYYPVSRVCLSLAQGLSEVIANVMGTWQSPQTACRYNAAGDADYYGIIRHGSALGVPSLLLEHSFHTHSERTRWLLEDRNLYRLAQAEAALIAEHYGLEVPELRYEFLKDIQEPSYRPTVEKLLEKQFLLGKQGQGEETLIDLGEDAIRLLVILDRAGIFGA